MTPLVVGSKRKLKMFMDEATCAACGGWCCKRMPGLTLPRDWGAPDTFEMAKRMVEALSSGDWAIDWWENDPRPGYEASNQYYKLVGAFAKVFYVRPATVLGKARRRMLDGSWGGQCVLWTEAGCPLPVDGRPAMCRLLEPNAVDIEKRGCHQHLSKRDVAIAWVPYQALLAFILEPVLPGGELYAGDD